MGRCELVLRISTVLDISIAIYIQITRWSMNGPTIIGNVIWTAISQVGVYSSHIAIIIQSQ